MNPSNSLYIHILLGKDIGEIMTLNMLFFSKEILCGGYVYNFVFLLSETVSVWTLVTAKIDKFLQWLAYSKRIEFFHPIKYINLLHKLFKVTIIFHSAYRNQTTLVGLFHLSAHIMLFQQHLEMKTMCKNA